MALFAPGLVAWLGGAALALQPGVPLVSRATAPSVVVWPADGSARGSEGDAQAVRDQGFDAVAFEPIASSIDDARARALQSERAELDRVRESLDRAQAEFLEQDWNAMLGELDTIEQTSLPLLATDAYCATLWEVEFRRGLALRFKGDTTAAGDRFRFAAALDPARRPTSEVYGPDVAQAFLAAVEAYKADVEQPLTLDVEPDDALVVVDCRAVEGKAVRLSPGLHVVRVEAPGHRPVAEVIDTRSDREASVTAPRDGTLPPIDAIGRVPAGTTAGLDAPSWAAVIDAAVDAVGADAFVWLTADDGRFAAQVVVDGKRGRRRVADGRSEAIALALEDLGRDGRLVMGRPEVADPDNGRNVDDVGATKKKGIARKWWFWTILGTVAVGAVAVGLGVGLTRGNGPDRLRLFAGG